MYMRNILVVDDDAITLELLENMLTKTVSGQIWTYDNSVEALKFIQQADRDTIDLIISDWNMPGIDGVTFLQKSRMRCPAIPFLMMTATPTRELVTECKTLGVDDFVVKPIHKDDFIEKVTALIMDD
ncbi:response regulator [Aestuariibacter halophilus]|uniref:Response regulator n=1 Tax=Fluctibacter halophilus TaxID=226011 RepID=A0ABS8G973_9ALTE|nr:response regulator [Aestuariibacter halophilus]MCC2617129.1 response regulator [Aestuariibacter halophilus]